MSTMDAVYDLTHVGALPARETRTRPAAWGFFGSLGWGLFAIATGLFGSVVTTAIWMLTHGLRPVDAEDASYVTIVAIVASILPVALLVLVVKLKDLPLRPYFALAGFSRLDLAIGTGCLVGLILVFGGMETLLGIDGGSKVVEASYRAAKLAGVLPLLVFAVVVVAPVTEELMFRGFLHRGWALSWLGVPGTIVLTSALWAALHLQYNAVGILLIFVMGLIFGWMRQRSGSTMLPMALHAFNNLFATIATAVQVEWLS